MHIVLYWVLHIYSLTEVVVLINFDLLQVNINLELEKLRIELRHVKGMYAMAQSETIDASRKVDGPVNHFHLFCHPTDLADTFDPCESFLFGS